MVVAEAVAVDVNGFVVDVVDVGFVVVLVEAVLVVGVK